MAGTGRRLVAGLTQTQARTTPSSADARLRGRTYAVPFERVWQASIKLASGGLRGWSMSHADDHDGVIKAKARPFLFGSVSSVVITITLDADAQTRVDMRSAYLKGIGDLGGNARRIGRFFRALDRALGQ